MHAASFKLGVREPTIPGGCYDRCNTAYLEAQTIGRTPALCKSTSSFKNWYYDCDQCLKGASSKDPGPRYHIGDPGLDPFAQYIDYCAALEAGSSIDVSDTPTATPSYFTTITTTTWIAITLDNLVTSQALTARIPLESLPGWGRVSESTSTSSTPDPMNTSATTDANPSSSPGIPSTIGIIIGTLAAVLAIIAMAGTSYLWRRKRQLRLARLAEQETKAQLHGDSMTPPPPPPQEMDARCMSVEMEGDKRACFELDSTALRAELDGKGGGWN